MRRHLTKFLLCAIVLSVVGLAVHANSGSFSDNVTITFFDVGQGDAALAQLPRGQDILIDGGPDNQVSRKVGRALPFFDRFIDIVVLTHPEADHITGLINILRNYRVGKVLMPRVSNATEEYKAFIDVIEKKHIPVVYAKAGQVFQFDSGVSLEILSSGEDAQIANGLPLNDSSIVAKMTYHEIDAIFTGDISRAMEYELVSVVERLDSEILKVPHHGSRFSSSSDFVRAVSPSVAVVSSGRGNVYGHPHKETLERLRTGKVRILRTDTEGDITITSNGNTFEVITQRK